MMRVLLVDDEPLALERLQVAFAAIPDVELVGTAVDGADAARRIATLQPDLVVLDIQMPGSSGVEVVHALGDRPGRPEVVFVTAFDRFAIEAFELDATDYLLKPVNFMRLRVAVDRARRRIAQRDADSRATVPVAGTALPAGSGRAPAEAGRAYDSAIWVPRRQGAIRVPVETIDWIEAARDYVLLNTALKSHMLRAKMNELEQRLDPRTMIRIHRSHMVRIDAVVSVDRPGKGSLRLVLDDGSCLQVGPNYQDRTIRALRL